MVSVEQVGLDHSVLELVSELPLIPEDKNARMFRTMFYFASPKSMLKWLLSFALFYLCWQTAANIHYEITLGKTEQLSVRVCFNADDVQSFSLPTRDFQSTFSNIHIATKSLRIRRGQIRLPAELSEKAGCLEYRFDLGQALRQQNQRDISRIGKNILVNPNIWLLEPLGVKQYTLNFKLPKGIQVSAPWQPIDGSYLHYLRKPSASGWNPQVAFGPFNNVSIPIGEAHLDVVYLSHESANENTIKNADERYLKNQSKLLQWIEHTAKHVLLCYGEFPVPRVQVLLVSVEGMQGRMRGSIQAVPFARVLRRGGSAVQFFINPAAALDTFMQDWTATHEFSHLLIPYVNSSDGWLSEGIASYYQNVLRARAGVISEREAWQKLYEGFQRGSRQKYTDTLAESIRNRGENRTMRMYWSGAAIALLADVELRQISQGKQSLDTALKALADCCLPSERSWSGRELMSRLDALTGYGVFMGLYRRWVNSTHFPATAEVFQNIGVHEKYGLIKLSGDRDHILKRREIMGNGMSL